MRSFARRLATAAVVTPLVLLLLVMAAGGVVVLAERRDQGARPERRLARLRAAFGPDLSSSSLARSVSAVASVTAAGSVPLIRLDGPPYVRGFAQGFLLQESTRGVLVGLMARFDEFALDQGARAMRRNLGLSPGGAGERVLRAFLSVPGVLPFGRWWLFGGTWRRLQPHVPAHLLDEALGLADGADVAESTVERLLAVSELFSAGCSSVAVFGGRSVDGRLRHFRNLDWSLETGIQRFPVLFEHAPSGSRRGFLSVGFAAFPGALQGVNDAGITLAEVGAGSRLQSYDGQPMVVRLRRVLEEAGDLAAVERILREEDRTKGYNFVVGSTAEGRALAFETNRERVAVFRDDDERERSNPWAFPIKDAVLRGDWAVDPEVRSRQSSADGPGDPSGAHSYRARYRALGEALRAGGSTPLATPDVLALAQLSGRPSDNLVSVVYAPEGLFFSYAEGSVRACDRPYLHLPWAQLRWTRPAFAEARP